MAEGWSYRHRPAKNIERHFIVDMARRFVAYTKATYQYVGFGAIEFLDFELMHRALNIKRMISIESRDTSRPEFNKPYKAITILPGHTNLVLSDGSLDLGRPSIVWFDYLKPLRPEEISDLKQVARQLAAPSFLLFSFNCHPEPLEERLTNFTVRVGKDHVPEGTTKYSLAKDGLGLAQREVATSVIERALRERKDDVEWFQVLNLQYQDNARMQTIGGLIMPAGTTRREVDSMFRGLDCYRPGAAYLDLRVPVVTPRERARLDRQLPKESGARLRLPVLEPADLEAYRHVYRYLHLAGLQSAAETTWTA